MIQFRILSGKSAGTNWVARRFPVRVGRAASSDLRLEETGVWDDHFKLQLYPREGYVLEAQLNTLVSVNNESVERAVLRNGDKITFGSVNLQFWLSDARQSGLRIREALTWIGLVALSLGQIALIYFLLP